MALSSKISKQQKIKKTIWVFAFLLILSFIFVAPIADAAIGAFGGFGQCNKLGGGLEKVHSVDKSKIILPDVTARKWTAEELFGQSLYFTVYTGDGEGTIFLADNLNDERPGRDNNSLWTGNAVVKNRMTSKDVRSFGRCITGTFQSGLTSIPLSISKLIVGATKFMTTSLFSTSFICEDPANPQGVCINLLGVIGGTSDTDKGIIGVLTHGIYMPLLVLAFLCVAIYLAYTGLVKRKFREALTGVAWSLAAMVFGLMFLLLPQLLASAPQKIGNAISGCIVMAINGENCMDTNSSSAPLSSVLGEECKSSASGATADQKMELMVNGLNCSVWKTFTLDTWARGQFGRPYNELYTKNPPEGGKIWQGLEAGQADNYCIHMTSSKSVSQMGDYVEIDQGSQVCNLALYHLYLSSGVLDTTKPNDYGNKVTDDSLPYDQRWYSLIPGVANDAHTWKYWAPTGGASRIDQALFGMISTLIACASLIIFSVFGMIYRIAGTVLMTFAPLFFLFAIHPGRGRKIFLGWFSQVVSSILKYAASSFFVIVALTLYASVLGTVSGWTAFVGVIVMAGVLLMYRKEIINLIGRADMGGEQLSNKVGEKFNKAGQKGKQLAAGTIGGAVGASLANDTSHIQGGNVFTRNLRKAGSNIAAGARGSKEGFDRELRRGQTVTAHAAKQYARQGKQNEAEIKERAAARPAEGAREATSQDASTNNSAGGSTGGVAQDNSASEVISNIQSNSVPPATPPMNPVESSNEAGSTNTHDDNAPPVAPSPTPVAETPKQQRQSQKAAEEEARLGRQQANESASRMAEPTKSGATQPPPPAAQSSREEAPPSITQSEAPSNTRPTRNTAQPTKKAAQPAENEPPQLPELD